MQHSASPGFLVSRTTIPFGRYGPGSTCGRIGRLAAGMHRLGYDLQLAQYDERGWRATFYTSGMEHPPTGALGTSWKTFVEKRRNSITIGAATHERSA